MSITKHKNGEISEIGEIGEISEISEISQSGENSQLQLHHLKQPARLMTRWLFFSLSGPADFTGLL